MALRGTGQAPTLQMDGLLGATSPDAWGLYMHLSRLVGLPSSVMELPDKVQPRKRTKLDVAVYEPLGQGSTVMLCTVGGCDRVMQNGRYAELFLLTRGLTEAHRLASARLLKLLVRSPFSTEKPLEEGMLLGLPPAHAGPWARFAAFLVAAPTTFQPGFSPVRFRGGKVVDLFWLVPLLAAEVTHVRSHGPATVMDAMAARCVDVAQLERPSSV